MIKPTTSLFSAKQFLLLMLIGFTSSQVRAQTAHFTPKSSDWLQPQAQESAVLSPDVVTSLLGSEATIKEDLCPSHWLYWTYDCFKEGAGEACGEAGICRSESFGREPTNVCAAPESFTQSGKNMARATLPDATFTWRAAGKKEALCLTCENMMYFTDDEILAKLACLQETAARVQTVYAEKLFSARGIRSHRLANNMDDINARGRLLFELSNANTTAPEPYYAFYLPSEAILAHVHADALDIDARNRALTTMCAAFTQAHVSTRRIETMFNACLAVANSPYAQEGNSDYVTRQMAALEWGKNSIGRYVREVQPITAATHAHTQAMIAAWTERAFAVYPVDDHAAVQAASDMMVAYAASAQP